MDQRSNSPASGDSRTVHRALDIIELLVNARRSLALSEIVESVGGPKTTVHRLLGTLHTRGYVSHDPRTGAYSAGVRCFELGTAWASGLDLRGVAGPVMARLNEATQETIHLAIYEQGDAVYVDKLESTLPVVPRSYVGRRCPAPCVAPGRVLLAHQPADEIDRMLKSPLPQYTAQTITDPAELADLLARVRAEGYATNFGAYRDSVGGVAAPIHDHTGAVVASVGACVPLDRLGEDQLPFLRARTVAAAAEISGDLGSRTADTSTAAPVQPA